MRRFGRVLRPVTIACLLAGCGSSTPTTPTTGTLTDPTGYLTTLVGLMQGSSVNRLTIDWTSFRAQVLAMATPNATSIMQLAPAIQLALRLLGDHHSYFLTASGSIITNPTSPSCQAASFSKTPQLPVNVGYVYSGACSGCNVQTYASQIQGQIQSADSKGPLAGWIVDLRSNTGGDYIPMVTGLGSILGDGLAGYFVYPDATTLSWSYNEGVMTQGSTVVMTYANPYALKAPNPPVAVLTDNLTASSGEATLVSFLGRPNTRTFGAATCGLSTGNQGYSLPDGSTLILTVSIDADRTMKEYGGSITPDVVVSGSDQAVVDAAAAWLTTLPPNRSRR